MTLASVITTVISIDSALALVTGLIVFFAPDKIADFVFQKETDGVHWHLVRCIGGQIMASSFMLWRLRNRPAETRTMLFLLRITSFAFAIFFAFNTRSWYPDLVPRVYLNYLIGVGFFVIAVYVVLLVATRWPIGSTMYADHLWGNLLYQLDSLASIVIGMAWIASPRWLLHRQVNIVLDDSHDLCGKIMGSLFVAGNVVSGHALHWRHERDRNVAAEGRLACCAAILTAQVWSQYAYERDWAGSHWVGISLFSTWTVIAAIYRTYTFFFATTTTTQGKAKSK